MINDDADAPVKQCHHLFIIYIYIIPTDSTIEM